jgi:hypothetical protein
VQVNQGYGLTAVVADAAEAVAGAWTAVPDLDLVRVNQPTADEVPALVAAGFVHKPSWLTWIAEVGADEAEFIARLSLKQRNNVRVAARRAAAEGLSIQLRRPVDEALFETFLELYERRVALMVHGLPLARRHAPSIVGNPDYFAVLGYAGARLVGCTIGQHCPEQDLLRLRFSAVEAEQRQASLARVMYLAAVGQAREAGHRWATLGNDPNIYGHLVKPGLIGFKARMGFRPVPSQALVPGDGNDEADLIVSLRAFTDPTVLLGYPSGTAPSGAAPLDGVAGWPALEAVVVGTDPDADLRVFDIPGLVGVRRLRPPPDRTP